MLYCCDSGSLLEFEADYSCHFPQQSKLLRAPCNAYRLWLSKGASIPLSSLLLAFRFEIAWIWQRNIKTAQRREHLYDGLFMADWNCSIRSKLKPFLRTGRNQPCILAVKKLYWNISNVNVLCAVRAHTQLHLGNFVLNQPAPGLILRLWTLSSWLLINYQMKKKLYLHHSHWEDAPQGNLL